MGHFIIALIALAFGFFLGVRSKAIPKRTRKPGVEKLLEEQLSGGNVYVKNTSNIPKYRNAPPPPTPRTIREGHAPPKPKSKVDHVKPGMLYDRGTFSHVNKCSSCNAIGHNYDMHTHNPCPKCGGDVERNGAAKWDGDKWIMSKV